MPVHPKYFFCGIGGSGMLPLAVILKAQGADITGSDRSHDQGRSREKFSYIEKQGIALSPQDGAGLRDDMVLVVSSAIEDSIPEVRVAKERNIPILKRSALLASLFNKAKIRIAVAGTSGKSTTTGMLGYVLHELGKNPTVMNGAVFRNFVSKENPFATALAGNQDLFITEADESDGSIEKYNPTIAVLNNISLDHKSVEELRALFGNFIAKADTAIINYDNEEVRTLSARAKKTISYSLKDRAADIYGHRIVERPDGIECVISYESRHYDLVLNVPGYHNISNAMACVATLAAMGHDLNKVCEILARFSGVKRRMEIVGTENGITVIDDFAHNPDKIEATLQTLKSFPGRLLVIFQMHGFGPLKLMRQELLDSFARYLSPEDGIFMPEVLYLGGTADQSYTARHFVEELNTRDLNANWFEKREEIIEAVTDIAEVGDRIIVMGARDDTLSDFAQKILTAVR